MDLFQGRGGGSGTKSWGNPCPSYHLGTRQEHHRTRRTQADDDADTTHQNSSSSSMSMTASAAGSSRMKLVLSYSSLTPVFVSFLLLLSAICVSSEADGQNPTNQTFGRGQVEQLLKLKRISARLKLINKPSLKTIQSPDGDLIDCVLSHQQPAFDHPKLRGQKPLDPPKRPKGYNRTGWVAEKLQLWTIGGEICPEGTIPIRRTTEEDFLRARSLKWFGKKATRQAMRAARRVRRDSTSSGHEHAVGYVMGDQYYGAKASMSVWNPHVSQPNEFSLSQIWLISGNFGNDLNTIEAGWQVSPALYGDSRARFFTYWTTDAYRETGCYNLLCSGFVQTNHRIAIGAAISPTSTYNARQFDITLLIWKDPKHGNWWLELGSGTLVGYWPASLFSKLKNHASMVQFGGEIVNNGARAGFHTTTQMGSGHFAQEGFRRSSYFRNLQVVDWDNNLIPPSNLRLLADHSNCYDIQGGYNRVWGNYFYYGGPGRNPRCP